MVPILLFIVFMTNDWEATSINLITSSRSSFVTYIFGPHCLSISNLFTDTAMKSICDAEYINVYFVPIR